MPDHVHLLTLIPATLTIAELVNKYKSNSSKWIHETFPELQDFRWQTKYGAFGVSQSMSPTVKNYLHHQAKHHRQRSFEEEMIELLERHGIEWDDRFLGE
jgi:putative transposase